MTPAAATAAARSASPTAAEDAAACRHCGSPSPPGASFCCNGCAAAHALVHDLGLDGYYARRSIDPRQRPLKPDGDTPAPDFSPYVETGSDGTAGLILVVEGLHCGACVWLIESVLSRQSGIAAARLNMTTRRLSLRWHPDATDPATLIGAVTALGYRLVPCDPAAVSRADAERDRTLLRAMAVAGFAFGNIMLLSVSIWAGHGGGMGPATRTLLHWLSALVALPAILYAGRPFFRSALAALAHRRTNMDVPISLGVTLAAAMSLYETIRGAEHAYFDSAVGLLFFLLIGRYLDTRARGRARSSVEHLMALRATSVSVIDADGHTRSLVAARVRPGMIALAAAGERIAIDGRIVSGRSTIDTSLIDGESLPKPVGPGATVFAGTLNLDAPLRITITAVGEGTLLAEIGRLVEASEQQRSRYVVLADRVARFYTPFVHSAALATFLGWWLVAGAAWQSALLNAITVLIITCPCALALAVPVAQVVAVGRLLRRGILVKSGTALERLAGGDAVAFDKTGTLTEGRPLLLNAADIDGATLQRAAGLAVASRHPLARALVDAAERCGPPVAVAAGVREFPGQGLDALRPDGPVRLGSRSFVGIVDAAPATGPELWFAEPGREPVRFTFADHLRADAPEVVAALRNAGFRLHLLSGDQPAVVADVARAAGIADWQASLQPADKVRAITALAEGGQRLVMVGDGLNDAPALAAAHASLSPSSAVDVSQVAADVVFQGATLAPVLEAIGTARATQRIARQNLVLALLYNSITVPLAVAGLVTPLIAAVAMSSSSLVVITNALRLNRTRSAWTSSST
jgi:copper-(or silver)-translocating P-type ATPase/heavy metal-(Cd/Co/Hg/Pb/Zn)-translocating P-type ATPase